MDHIYNIFKKNVINIIILPICIKINSLHVVVHCVCLIHMKL
jgi:hypothetical protein